VSGWLREGGAVLCSFIDWFLLLLVARCLFAWCLSRVSRVLHHHLCLAVLSLRVSLCHCERDIEGEEMGENPLDRDARIKLSIGTEEAGDADGQFNSPCGLAFDHHRGLLIVLDSSNHRVQVFSCDDDEGFSFVSTFGEYGDHNPCGIAIDHDHDRILIVDRFNHRVQSWSLSNQSLLSSIGQYGSGDLEFTLPEHIAIDNHHHRIIVVDAYNHRLVFLSSIDLSFLFSIGGIQGSRPGELDYPSSIAIDDDRCRIIVCDSGNHRMQVLSSIDGSFLLEFGQEGDQPGELSYPQGLCIDNQGRIIVADYNNLRLQSFTPEGHHISSLDCGTERPSAVAFDEHRGLIAFSAGNQVHVIGANQWLADTLTWRPDRHRYAPSWMKQAISTMTMIRSLIDGGESASMSMIPNEILFEIFSFL